MDTRNHPTTQAVWSQLSDDLRRFIRRRVNDEHLADDLLQETFVRIHKNLPALHDAARVSAWVYRIARRVIVDHYRARNGSPAALEDETPVAATERPDWPGQSAEWLREVVGQLPETYRQAVELSELEGFTQQAVADHLGLSLSGAKSRIQRGRARLRQLLLDCCHFEFDRRGNLLECDPRPDRTVCRNCADLEDGC